MVGFIGADEHIIADLTNDLHGDVFMLGVRDSDEVRMVAVLNLAAGGAAAAGGILPAAQNRGSQQLCQCVLAGTGRTRDQIEMGDVSPAQAAC